MFPNGHPTIRQLSLKGKCPVRCRSRTCVQTVRLVESWYQYDPTFESICQNTRNLCSDGNCFDIGTRTPHLAAQYGVMRLRRFSAFYEGSGGRTKQKQFPAPCRSSDYRMSGSRSRARRRDELPPFVLACLHKFSFSVVGSKPADSPFRGSNEKRRCKSATQPTGISRNSYSFSISTHRLAIFTEEFASDCPYAVLIAASLCQSLNSLVSTLTPSGDGVKVAFARLLGGPSTSSSVTLCASSHSLLIYYHTKHEANLSHTTKKNMGSPDLGSLPDPDYHHPHRRRVSTFPLSSSLSSRLSGPFEPFSPL